MSDLNEELKTLSDTLKQQRDELKLQLHLAKADLRDEWDQLEKQWHQFRDKLGAVAEQAEESGQEIVHITKQLGQEIKRGYSRIKSQL